MNQYVAQNQSNPALGIGQAVQDYRNAVDRASKLKLPGDKARESISTAAKNSLEGIEGLIPLTLEAIKDKAIAKGIFDIDYERRALNKGFDLARELMESVKGKPYMGSELDALEHIYGMMDDLEGVARVINSDIDLRAAIAAYKPAETSNGGEESAGKRIGVGATPDPNDLNARFAAKTAGSMRR